MIDLEQFVWEKCGCPMETRNEGEDWCCTYCDRVGNEPIDARSEITLAHILMGLSAYFDMEINARGGKIFIEHVMISDFSGKRIERGCFIEWDLTKNFSEQSGETKMAIAKLLGWKDE
jgi:hypothetical protein